MIAYITVAHNFRPTLPSCSNHTNPNLKQNKKPKQTNIPLVSVDWPIFKPLQYKMQSQHIVCLYVFVSGVFHLLYFFKIACINTSSYFILYTPHTNKTQKVTKAINLVTHYKRLKIRPGGRVMTQQLKNNGCPFRGPWFDSHNTHGGFLKVSNSSPGESDSLFWPPWASHMWFRFTFRQKKKKKKNP